MLGMRQRREFSVVMGFRSCRMRVSKNNKSLQPARRPRASVVKVCQSQGGWRGGTPERLPRDPGRLKASAPGQSSPRPLRAAGRRGGRTPFRTAEGGMRLGSAWLSHSVSITGTFHISLVSSSAWLWEGGLISPSTCPPCICSSN